MNNLDRVTERHDDTFGYRYNNRVCYDGYEGLLFLYYKGPVPSSEVG